MTGTLEVAVCLVTHDSVRDVPECLATLGRSRPRPCEIVVVDCASRDGSAEAARSGAPAGIPTRVLPLAENAGFAGGMNRAMAATTAPLLLALNPDARPEPEFLGRLVAALERWPQHRLGALTGRLLRFARAGHPDRLDACGMRLLPTWRHLDRASGEIDRGQLSEPELVFGATGAACLYRREALDDVAVEGAYFLPEFHSFREDAELCFRLRERGWGVLYEPAARCRHRRLNLPRRRRRMRPEVNCHSLKNRYLLRAYHQTERNLVLTALPAFWRDLLALGWVLLAERHSLAAYRWLWRHRRLVSARRRYIQGRRTVPSAAVDRWFFRQAEVP